MRDNNIVLSINVALQWPRLCHVDAPNLLDREN
jgi:hypothetical protein